jgi:hypothetical protein
MDVTMCLAWNGAIVAFLASVIKRAGSTAAQTSELLANQIISDAYGATSIKRTITAFFGEAL